MLIIIFLTELNYEHGNREKGKLRMIVFVRTV